MARLEGVLLGPDGVLRAGAIEFDSCITAIEAGDATRSSPPPPGAPVIAPGFVDLQVNGTGPTDVAAATTRDDWAALDGRILAQGVTTWCPTLVSAPLGAMSAALERIASAVARGLTASVAGAHLEGPFLGGAIGAHRPEHITGVDREWLAALPPIVRIVTLGPEAPGAVEATALLAGRGVLVSLGHSRASADAVLAAVDAGARLVTHVFNGMAALHHRDLGLLGTALTDDRLSVSVIADGVHVAPPLLRLLFRAKPAGRILLVTDAVAHGAGRGLPRLVDGAPRLADGTLAGSALTMDGAVRRCVAAGVDLGAALSAASSTPAALLGLDDRGALAVGRRADLVVLDADTRVSAVYVGGELVGAAHR